MALCIIQRATQLVFALPCGSQFLAGRILDLFRSSNRSCNFGDIRGDSLNLCCIPGLCRELLQLVFRPTALRRNLGCAFRFLPNGPLQTCTLGVKIGDCGLQGAQGVFCFQCLGVAPFVFDLCGSAPVCCFLLFSYEGGGLAFETDNSRGSLR